MFNRDVLEDNHLIKDLNNLVLKGMVLIMNYNLGNPPDIKRLLEQIIRRRIKNLWFLFPTDAYLVVNEDFLFLLFVFFINLFVNFLILLSM